MLTDTSKGAGKGGKAGGKKGAKQARAASKKAAAMVKVTKKGEVRGMEGRVGFV
jgi:hypothetical protein